MEKNNLIQSLSFGQWWHVWRAYWRLWPILLRIKFKQLFKDPRWFTKKITFDQRLIPNSKGMPIQACDFEQSEYVEFAQQLHELIRLAARLHFLPATCLPRSIVLSNLLSARGIDSSVVIGVNKHDGQFASHAWVEVEGHMVAEPESVGVNFTPLV